MIALHASGIFQILGVVLEFFQSIPTRYISSSDARWQVGFNWINDKTARLWELVPRMSFAEVQKIIGAHEEATRSNDGPGMQGVCGSAR